MSNCSIHSSIAVFSKRSRSKSFRTVRSSHSPVADIRPVEVRADLESDLEVAEDFGSELRSLPASRAKDIDSDGYEAGHEYADSGSKADPETINPHTGAAERVAWDCGFDRGLEHYRREVKSEREHEAWCAGPKFVGGYLVK